MAIPAPIQAFIDRQTDAAPRSYDDLRAVIFNGTLERSPEPSHTDGLLAIVLSILERTDVETVQVRTVDHEIPPGVWPDMRDHGYETDDFPAIYRDAVAPADIILVAGPIWLGDQSSQTRKIIERLYAYSADVNSAGQWSYYGKVGGALTTGNEDGGKPFSPLIFLTPTTTGVPPPPLRPIHGKGEPGPGPSFNPPRKGPPRQPRDAPQNGVQDRERVPPPPEAQRGGGFSSFRHPPPTTSPQPPPPQPRVSLAP